MSVSLGAGALAAIGLGLPLLALLAYRRVPAIAVWLRTVFAWRRSVERPTDMVRAAAYHAGLPDHARAGALDDRTWDDLDLDDVFCALDHTVAEPGRQYLYHLLRTPQFSTDSLERRERLVGRLTNDPALTEILRSSLGRLRHPRAGDLVHLILGPIPPRPPYWLLFPLLTVTSVASLVLFLTVWPPAFVVWLVVCLVNLCVQLFYKPRVKRFVPAIRELPAFVGVAGELGALDIAEAREETSTLRDGSTKLAALRRAARWLVFEPGDGNGSPRVSTSTSTYCSCST